MAQNNAIHPYKIGVALGGLLGLWHLGWATLVAIGLAQPLIDTMSELHMVNMNYVVLPFEAEKAIGLVLVTAGFGFILGYLFGMIWNASRKV